MGKAMEEKEITNFYSNVANIIISAKDAVLLFGVNVPQPGFKSGEIEESFEPLTRIYMSPVQFKSFIQVATDQLHRYEESYGLILDTKQESQKNPKLKSKNVRK